MDEYQHLLRIEGYDKDVIGKDDQLGTCEININNLTAFERRTEWYPLKQATRGEIRLMTLFISLNTR